MHPVPVLLVVACLSLPAWPGDKTIPISPAQRAALRITTAPVVAHAGAMTVGLPATVAIPPAQERVVAAPFAGLLARVDVAGGETVRAGQVLAVLRGEELVTAQRDLAQAAVQLRLATETSGRDEALFQEGIIPESRLQSARAALAQARAQVAERRAWLRLMGLAEAALLAAEWGERLTDSVALVAPLAGVVLEQSAVTGARVDMAAPLFRVARLDPLWLEIQAPAELAAMVKKGQRVSVPGTSAQGRVVSVGRSVTAAQTVLIRARVANPDGRLRLHQSVSARLEDLAGARQWRVPVRALVRAQGQNWVFVERPGGFEPEAVKVLGQSAQSAAVDGPFGGEERIAVEGVAALKAAWQGMGGE
ncbi:MAG: efflux RND transporter periplasmic adaptor subunit [Thiobacillaceae bacterium]|jgi:RND family efflux transporter MFP subunit|nr:efflux RND transporter periplasmic adaptor subunit [Thiobacillaceae bacterium]